MHRYRYNYMYSVTLVSQVAQCQKRRHIFNPWVGKIPWRRKWQPTPVLFLPGESHGQRSLAGCSPWGHKESGTTEGVNTWSLACVWDCKPHEGWDWVCLIVGFPSAWDSANTHGITAKCPNVCFSQQDNEISSALLWDLNHTPSPDQMKTLPAVVK